MHVDDDLNGYFFNPDYYRSVFDEKPATDKNTTQLEIHSAGGSDRRATYIMIRIIIII